MYNNYSPYTANMYLGTQRQEVVRVNGRNGANAYQMAPNSSALLLDETAPIVWLKMTDGASYPTITGYTLSPIEEHTEKTNYQDLESRIARLEEVINGKSDTSDAKQIKTIVKSTQQ